MQKMFYLPWVGENFQKGINGKKVIVITANHLLESNILIRENYLFNDINNISIELMNSQKNNCAKNSYKPSHLEKIILGKVKPSKTEIFELWDSLIFYNFCQKKLNKGKEEPPTFEMLNNSLNTFQEFIKEYRPNIIITFSKYISNFLFAKMNCKEIENINDSPIYSINYQNEDIIFSPQIISSINLDFRKRHEVFNKALQLSN